MWPANRARIVGDETTVIFVSTANATIAAADIIRSGSTGRYRQL